MADVFREVILDASYEGVAFHVSEEDGEAVGHDSVKHVAYLRPGTENEHTGRRAKSGTLTILMFNDIEPGLFPGRYQDLINTVTRTPKGSLVHPVEGLMTAFIDSIHRSTSSTERDGVRLKAQWTEDNASASSLLRFSGSPAVNAPEAVAQQAVAADQAMATTFPGAVPGIDYFLVTNLITATLDALESQVRAVAEIEASLRLMEQSVTANITSPLLAGVDAYDAVVALVALRASIVQLRPRYLPDASRIRQYRVPVTMPIWVVSQQVYGTADKGDLILSANSVPDPLFIAAGSVLSILPAG